VNPKTIVTMLLLAFVAAAAGFLVLKEMRGKVVADPVPADVASGSTTGAPAAVAEDPSVPRKLVAYYFHGNKRCNTCRAIQAQSKEALDTGFPEALMAGLLEWREVNLDDPGNDHFTTDYDLTGSGLVLVDLRNGRLARFKNLLKVWDLWADKPAFLDYVQGETRNWLEAP
jgi:hypothetical protein